MSRNPTDLSSGQRIGVNLITMPFAALFTAASFVRKGVEMVKSAPKPAPQVPPSREAAPSPVAPKSIHAVADRVCGAQVMGQRISLYQYHSAGMIRVCARANRVLQEAVFTPAIAAACGIAYDFDGAIQWIRERGFAGASLQNAKAKSSGPTNEPTDEDGPPFDQPYKSPTAARQGRQKATTPKSITVNAAGTQSTLVPVESSRGRPFTGHIRSFGEETRRGREGEKPYLTYVMKVDSESGGFTKDFVGEHLSELVEQYSLHVGQLITIQLTSREIFEVDLGNGKREERRRNHFSITTH